MYDSKKKYSYVIIFSRIYNFEKLDRNDPNIQSQIYKIMNYKTNNDKKAKQTLTPKEFADFLKVSKQGSE